MTSRTERAIPEWRLLLLVGVSTIPLVLGGAIYLIWRDTSLLMFRWVEKLHVSSIIFTARECSVARGAHLPDWVLYSLPNALWVLSLVSTAGLLWRGAGRTSLTIAVITAACLGLGGEVAQGLTLLPGTFSMTDLMLATLAALAGGALALLGDTHAT